MATELSKKTFKPNKEKINELLDLINSNKNKTTSPPSSQGNNNTLIAYSQPQQHTITVSASQSEIADSPEKANNDMALPLAIATPITLKDSTAKEITTQEDPVSEINITQPPVTADQSNDGEFPDAALDAPNETLNNMSSSNSSYNEINEYQEAPSNSNEIQNDLNNLEHDEEIIKQSENGSPRHTQFQDVLNNPENYEVVSAIDEDDTDAYQVPEFMFTHRNRDTLWFIYPFSGALKCTERGCNFTTSQKEWFKRCSGLTNHLKRTHNIVCKYNEKWCSSCNSRIRHLYHTSRHTCLADLPVSTPREEVNEDMPFKCNKCNEFGACNKHALATHLQKHEADEAKERYRQRMQANTPRANNNTISPDASQPQSLEEL